MLRGSIGLHRRRVSSPMATGDGAAEADRLERVGRDRGRRAAGAARSARPRGPARRAGGPTVSPAPAMRTTEATAAGGDAGGRGLLLVHLQHDPSAAASRRTSPRRPRRGVLLKRPLHLAWRAPGAGRRRARTPRPRASAAPAGPAAPRPPGSGRRTSSRPARAPPRTRLAMAWLCADRSSFGTRFTCRSAWCGAAAGSSGARGR